MKIAVGCMMHESNSFTRTKTSLDQFDTLWGADVFARCDGARHPFGGIVDTLRAMEAELVPTFYGRAMISGTVEYEAYRAMKQAIVDGIGAGGKLDGVCLALHGSMFVDGVEDPEGDLLAAVRALVGPAVPIVCALDMHATLTDRMLASATAFTAYRTAPHTDTYETGVRAAELLRAIIDDRAELVTAWIKIPMLLCGEQSETAVPPMREMIDLIVNTTSERPEMMNAEYLLGFPWADTPHHGVSVIVTGRRSDEQALREIAAQLANRFWERRHDFRYSTEAYPLDPCLDAALAHPGGPVIISDTGDNPTAGASEDLTLVLNRLIERGIDRALVAVIVDPAARARCEWAGVGAALRLSLGRLEPALHAPPLQAEVYVQSLGTAHGIRSAVVVIDQITVIITDSRTPVYDPGFIDELGIRLQAFKLVIIKCGYMSPEYQRLASRKLFALTPGDTNIDMTSIPYTRLPRPIYPIDREMHWEANESAEPPA